MAELNGKLSERRTVAENTAARPGTAWTASQTRAQYGAIARLRWQMYRNGFRRKGGKGDLAATIVVAPIALVIVAGACLLAGAGAGFAVWSGHVERLSWVLWGIFFVSQLVNINLGQQGTTFDPTQLIRFPMSVRSYTAVRLFFGILSPGNVLVTLMSLAAATGATIARPALAGWVFVAVGIFAVVNVLFTRMVFAWVDRWLSTRRAREVFTALIFLVSIGAQALNFMYNPAYHNKRMDFRKVHAVQGVLAKTEPYLRVLPPELAGMSVASAARGHVTAFAISNAADVAWGFAFLAVFGLRMNAELRGESLSDAANAVRSAKPAKHPAATHVAPAAIFVAASERPTDVTRVVAAKELLYLRRNTGLFYGLVMPLLMVLIFAGKWAGRSGGGHGDLIVMAALAYGLIGVFPMGFNSFGLDGTGTQTYFIAPVRLRDVLMGKNVLCAGLALAETFAILAVLSYVGRVPSGAAVLDGLLWMTTTLLIELTVGNYMSLRSPKRIDPGRTARKQARPASAFLSMGIVLALGVFGALVVFVVSYQHVVWIGPIVFLCTAIAALAIYRVNLNKLDAYGWMHRDALFQELQKKA